MDPTTEHRDSDEYKFDPDRRPLEATDSPEATAAEYGIYGYIDHPSDGAARPAEGISGAEPLEGEPPPPEGVEKSAGGQDVTESAHGAGVAQPMANPQRHASQSPLPDEATERHE